MVKTQQIDLVLQAYLFNKTEDQEKRKTCQESLNILQQ